jgi:tetratricopeptide (TPR) repeat protein
LAVLSEAHIDALATILPNDRNGLVIVGEGAPLVASKWGGKRSARIATGESCEDLEIEVGSHIVLCRPVSFDEAAEEQLRTLYRIAKACRGTICLFFPASTPADSGEFAPGYSHRGLEVTLCRAGLELVVSRPVTDAAGTIGWVARAIVREGGHSAFGTARCGRREVAQERNAAGEALFAQERYADAAVAFADALREWPYEAVFYNNLAALLWTHGDMEGAWTRAREALHYDPSLEAARNNVRDMAVALGREDEANRLLSLFGEGTEDRA